MQQADATYAADAPRAMSGRAMSGDDILLMGPSPLLPASMDVSLAYNRVHLRSHQLGATPISKRGVQAQAGRGVTHRTTVLRITTFGVAKQDVARC